MWPINFDVGDGGLVVGDEAGDDPYTWYPWNGSIGARAYHITSNWTTNQWFSLRLFCNDYQNYPPYNEWAPPGAVSLEMRMYEITADTYTDFCSICDASSDPFAYEGESGSTLKITITPTGHEPWESPTEGRCPILATANTDLYLAISSRLTVNNGNVQDWFDQQPDKLGYVGNWFYMVFQLLDGECYVVTGASFW
jgi:hypothetical protein